MTGEDDDDEVSPVTSPRYRHSNSMNKRREGSPSHEASLKDAEVLLSKTDPASSSSSCRPTSSPRTIPSSTPMTTNAQNLSVNPTTASLSHSTSAPTVISYVNNDNSDDDFTYVSDSDEETSESASNRDSVSRGRGSRSARTATQRHYARRVASGGGATERRLNLGESEEIKKMLEQDLSFSGGNLDQIQAFVVTEEDVDLPPTTCGESARYLAARLWAARWRVVPHHALPRWLQDNDYLLKGHRPELNSFAKCFKSIFRIHTETGNIWTHLLGAISFISIAVYVITRPSLEIQWQEKFVFSTFFMAAIICLSCSWMYHTMSCHSPSVAYVFAKLDYCGIAILTMGSFVPWLYYSFYCHFLTKLAYIVSICVLGCAAIVVSLWEKFAIPRFRPLRAGLFIGLGLSGIIPAIHYSVNLGFVTAFTEGALGWLILMAILYIGGALLYALRIPERFFPGQCDIWFQSHQIFHVFVVAAAFVHYHGICLMAAHRLAKGDCLPHVDQ